MRTKLNLIMGGEGMELIDWSERYPELTPFQLAVLESTYCLCGKPKPIGQNNCGCGRIAPLTPQDLAESDMERDLRG